MSMTLDAGCVPPSTTRYVVVDRRDHQTLRDGDVVVMTETPDLTNLFLRLSDMTLHYLQDESGYIIVKTLDG